MPLAHYLHQLLIINGACLESHVTACGPRDGDRGRRGIDGGYKVPQAGQALGNVSVSTTHIQDRYRPRSVEPFYDIVDGRQDISRIAWRVTHPTNFRIDVIHDVCDD